MGAGVAATRMLDVSWTPASPVAEPADGEVIVTDAVR
jgi:hypothetical protein